MALDDVSRLPSVFFELLFFCKFENFLNIEFPSSYFLILFLVVLVSRHAYSQTAG